MAQFHVDPPVGKSRQECPSCGFSGDSRYCGHCGERRGDWKAASSDANPVPPPRGLASRLRASLNALASPPGRLTGDWINGKRVGYLAPLSLFLWVNVAFFVVQSVTRLAILTWPLRVHLSDDRTGPLATRLFEEQQHLVTTPLATLPAVFDALESVHAKSLVVVMVPALAMVLWALMFASRRRIVDAMVFSTHFYTFALIWLCALFPAVAIILRLLVTTLHVVPATHVIDIIVSTLEATVLAWYLYVALATVFAWSATRRLVSAIALMISLYAILTAYHLIVFMVTLYSI